MSIIQLPKTGIAVGIPDVKVLNFDFIDPTPKKKSHAAEPIKTQDDLFRICHYLISQGRFRDNLLFVMGINFGFRCGDLLRLKEGHILQLDGHDKNGSPVLSYKSSITLQEGKTGKLRTVYLNDAVRKAFKLFIEDKGYADFDSYLFRSQSSRATANRPLDVRSVERILKNIINDELGFQLHASTHCLRKTFGYHVVMSAPDKYRAIQFLQTIFGHTSPAITFAYIGITDDEIEQTYQNLNLGEEAMDFGTSSGLKLVC